MGFKFFMYYVVLMAFSLAIDASAESHLTIDPPGPVAILNSSIIIELYRGNEYSTIDKNYEPAIITCRSTGNYYITWDVPDLNFAELSNEYVIHVVSCLALNVKFTKKNWSSSLHLQRSET